MSYLGDFSSTMDVVGFLATYNSSGGSVDRAVKGTPTVYKDGSTAGTTVGVTDTSAFAGVTGVSKLVVDLDSSSFYVPGSDYSLIVANSSIDSQTVNAPVFSWSIGNRSYQRAGDYPTNFALSSISTAGVIQADINSTAQTFDQTGDLLGNANDVLTLPGNSSLAVISTDGVIQADIDSTAQTFDQTGDVLGNVNDVLTLPANSSLGSISTDGEFAIPSSDVTDVQLTEAYAANGVEPTMRELLWGVQQTLQDFIINSTLLSVRKLDGSTAFVIHLDSTAPTAATRTS